MLRTLPSLLLLAAASSSARALPQVPSPVLLVDVDGGALYSSSSAGIVNDLVSLGSLPTGTTAADLDSRGRTLWIIRPTATGTAEAGTVDLDTLQYTVRGRNQPFTNADVVTASADGRRWFAVELDGNSARLFSGDVQHGRMSELSVLTDTGPITGLAAGLDGVLYAFADDTDEILTIDPVDGTITHRVTASLAGEAIGLDVDASTGKLVSHYQESLNASAFAELDPQSGQVSLLEDITALPFDASIVVQRSGREIDTVRICADAALNVTGVAGVLTARGDRFLPSGDLTLTASSLPASTFGLLLASRTAGTPITPPGSIGGLCLNGSIGRLAAPGGLLPTGPDGAFSATLDLTAIPQPVGTLAAQGFEAWYFQAWYRDSNQGAPTSNFTDAIQVAFSDDLEELDYLVPSLHVGPRTIRYQDVTGDGIEELVTIAYQTGAANPLEVFELDEDGLPVRSLGQTLSNWSGGITFHDLDADGDLDAVMTTRSARVAVLLGDGLGGFVEVARYQVCNSMHSVQVLDIDQDGLLDIGFGCPFDFESQVLYGLPQGGFGDLQSIPSGQFKPQGTYFRDLNGDSLPDIVYRGGFGAAFPNRYAYAVNQGARQFAASTVMPTPSQLFGAWMGDINGDGQDDLVTRHSGQIAIHLQSAAAVGFDDPILVPAASALECLDFNGDGLLDVLNQVGSSPGRIEIMLGRGDASFDRMTLGHYRSFFGATISGTFPSGSRYCTVQFSGTLEFIPIAMPPYELTTVVSQAYGTPTTNQESGVQPLELADVTGDGRLDAIFATASLSSSSATIGSIRLMEGRGNGRFTPGVEIAPLLARSLEIVDVNGDGHLDFLASIDGSFVGLRTYLGNGAGQFSFAGELAVNEPELITAAADFTGDGIIDVAIAPEAGGLTLHPGQGGGTFAAGITLEATTRLSSLVATDLDLDGRADLAAIRPGSEELVVYFSDAAAIGLEPAVVVGPGHTQVTRLDVDGDNVPDLATDGDDEIYVYLTLPDRQFVRFRAPIEDANLLGNQRLAGGDVDGDGLEDVILMSSTGLLFFRSQGYGAVSLAQRLGSQTVLGDLELGDLNGDGALELCTTTVRNASVTTVVHRAE